MASNETSFLIMLIQKCTSIRIGRQLHALVFTRVFNPMPFLNNNLITMYAKCDHQEDARKVFDKMPLRNVVSWNTLLSAYSRTPHLALPALELFRDMLDQGFRPNTPTFSSLLQAATSLVDQQYGAAIHSQVVKYGFLDDPCMQTCLLGMYSNCRNLNSATQIFQKMVCKDIIAWNSLISGYIKNNRIKHGLQLFSSMLGRNAIPNQFTFSIVLNACSRSEEQAIGEIIHAQMIKQDFLPIDTPLQNALIDMYSTFGDPETSFSIFRKIMNPDLVSWNSMLSSYSNNRDGEKAVDLFMQMRNNSAEKPDEYSFAAIVSATGGLPGRNYGEPLHAQVTKVGFESGIFVGSTLISMYFKNGETKSAQKLFNSMPEKDVILWAEMISGHTSSNECENAIKYFYQMLMEGHKPDNFAFSSVLHACADIAAFQQGEMIHSHVVKTGYEEDVFTCTSMVDMYAKNGSLENAILVFSGVEDPDLECWNSMLEGYSHHGNPDRAFELFDEMVKGVKPDHVTFISLLSACSHCGLVDQGKFYWNYMTEKGGLLPGPKHYACMVSLLSRTGLLQEAEELIERSPFTDVFPELWRILLSSCVMHRDLEMGVRAGERVLISEPQDSAALVLLSNLYADAGRWSDVAELRRKIRGLEKDPGFSWFEIKNEFHIFSAGDETHPQIDDIRIGLQRLRGNMKLSENLMQA